MKALSILQPYAWLIIRPDIVGEDARLRAYEDGLIKDIENRDWQCHYRGPVLVHAGKRYGPRIHRDYAEFYAYERITLPAYEEMLALTGGIVGQVTITGCCREHPSRWKVDGSWGMTLTDAEPLPFRPYRGQLGFFEVEQ